MAHPSLRTDVFELPAWKSFLSASSALLLGLLFIVAGVWKITDPYGAATRMAQAQVPASLSMLAALGFGTVETLAGVLLLIPRFRRWGALLTGAMLVAFMLYVGYFYEVLRGEECSCFPWVKRAVGPGFFIGDALMLAFAAPAYFWARRADGLRTPLLIVAAIAVFAGVSYGVHTARLTGTVAPESITTTEGKAFPLHQGRVLVYVFDPECMHCDAAARQMAKLRWGGTKVVAVPTRVPQFAQSFLRDTGLKATVSNDLDAIQKTFTTVGTPYAIALEYGRQKGLLREMEGPQLEATLRRLEMVE